MSTSNQSQITFEDGPELPAAETQGRTTGILPSQEISNLIARGNIMASPAIHPDHIQPASLDLRLGDMAHRVRANLAYLWHNGRIVKEGERETARWGLVTQD